MIQVARSSLPPFDEYCDEIREFWDSHWITNMGCKHKQLEEELKAYLKTPNLTLFVNGHLALENVIAAMMLPAGSEVITTPFTFASTTHAIVRNGLKPVFCDINLLDYTIDVSKIEALITENTSAIVPVHVYGNLCDTDAIQTLADKYHLKVIYDAAHTFGIFDKEGRSPALLGDASIFSFHATKVFNTIEGGAVCYRDEKLSVLLNDLKNFGIHNAESVQYVGGNAKMNEFAAAMGICNLRHVGAEIEKRQRADGQYRARLSGVSGIRLCDIAKGIQFNYAYFPVVFDGYKKNRNEVFSELAEYDIFARKYFYPLTNAFECYAGKPGYNVDDTPVAKQIADQVLCLPLYADLTTDNVDQICDIILK